MKGFEQFISKRCKSYLPMASFAFQTRTLFLNKQANILLGYPEYVTLFYNKETQQIALKPCEQNETAMKLGGKKSGSFLSLASFMNYFSIRFDPKTKFKISKKDEFFLLENIADL